MDFSLLQRFLLASVFYKVASAPESVFALEGNSVILTMKRNDSLDKAIWIFNQSSDVVRYYPVYGASCMLRVSAPYKGRVEFDNTTFSLELKKPMKNDSGLYTGEIHAATGRTVVEYRLSIYELVSAPVLTVELVASSGDLWNVSCRAGDLSLTSTCNSSTCTHEKMTALSRIIIFIEDGAIICNHSNSLSWRHATVTLWKRNQFSVSEFPSATKQRFEWIFMTGAGGLGGLLICGVVCFRAQLKKQGTVGQGET